MTITPSRFGRAFLALLLATVAAGLIAPVGAKPTKAAFPGANGKIVFASSRPTGTGVDNPELDDEIFTMEPDGTGLVQLTVNEANDYDPAWSAQGDAIAFVSQRDNQNQEIYVMDADGGGQTRLTTNAANDTNPTFSPNGSKIAFTSDRGPSGKTNIFVMDAKDENSDGNGDNLFALTAINTGFNDDPAWSPDGSTIAFESDRDDDQTEIYVMDPVPESATNVPVRLTNNTAGDFSANWSPDGSKIAFTRNRDGNKDIYVMNADGSGQKRLTKKAATDQDPAWSPDGRRIAFMSERAAGDREVYVMKPKPEGRKNRPKNLTKSALPDIDPDWQSISTP